MCEDREEAGIVLDMDTRGEKQGGRQMACEPVEETLTYYEPILNSHSCRTAQPYYLTVPAAASPQNRKRIVQHRSLLRHSVVHWASRSGSALGSAQGGRSPCADGQ